MSTSEETIDALMDRLDRIESELDLEPIEVRGHRRERIKVGDWVYRIGSDDLWEKVEEVIDGDPPKIKIQCDEDRVVELDEDVWEVEPMFGAATPEKVGDIVYDKETYSYREITNIEPINPSYVVVELDGKEDVQVDYFNPEKANLEYCDDRKESESINRKGRPKIKRGEPVLLGTARITPAAIHLSFFNGTASVLNGTGAWESARSEDVMLAERKWEFNNKSLEDCYMRFAPILYRKSELSKDIPQLAIGIVDNWLFSVDFECVTPALADLYWYARMMEYRINEEKWTIGGEIADPTEYTGFLAEKLGILNGNSYDAVRFLGEHLSVTGENLSEMARLGYEARKWVEDTFSSDMPDIRKNSIKRAFCRWDFDTREEKRRKDL